MVDSENNGFGNSRLEVVGGMLDSFQDCDWNNMHDVNRRSDFALREIAQPSILRELVLNLFQDEYLLSMCEHFDHFDKLVLRVSDVGRTRLRMHIFGDKFIEEAHNHRHCFSSLILKGEYIHYIHGSEDCGGGSEGGDVAVPVLVQRQMEGSCYSLHDSAVHSNLAPPNTVSLVLSGPSKREFFRIKDKKSGEERIRYGAKQKPGLQEKGEGRISEKELHAIVEVLEKKGVI